MIRLQIFTFIIISAISIFIAIDKSYARGDYVFYIIHTLQAIYNSLFWVIYIRKTHLNISDKSNVEIFLYYAHFIVMIIVAGYSINKPLL